MACKNISKNWDVHVCSNINYIPLLYKLEGINLQATQWEAKSGFMVWEQPGQCWHNQAHDLCCWHVFKQKESNPRKMKTKNTPSVSFLFVSTEAPRPLFPPQPAHRGLGGAGFPSATRSVNNQLAGHSQLAWLKTASCCPSEQLLNPRNENSHRSFVQ